MKIKSIVLALMIFLAIPVYAQKKIPDLPVDTSPKSSDITIIVISPYTSGTDRKTSLGDLITKAHGLTGPNSILGLNSGNTMISVPLSTDSTFAAPSDSKVPSQKAVSSYVEAKVGPSEYNNGTISTSLSVSPSNGSKQKLTLGGNCTISFVQPSSGTFTVLLKIIQATGATHYNPSWTSVSWLTTQVAPIIYQTDGAIDFVSCYLDGTSTYCISSH